MVPILVDKNVFEPNYDLKFTVWNHNYFKPTWRNCAAAVENSITTQKFKKNYHMVLQFFLLDMYLKALQVRFQDICTTVFIAPLFTVVKSWKQPKH